MPSASPGVIAIGSQEKAVASYFSAEVSASIRIARVMCITLMMFVHIWPGAGVILAAEVPPGLQLFYHILIDQFARASVPLLGIVSGLLFFHSVAGSTWQRLIASKVRTLLVPMAAWSALTLVMFAAEAAATGKTAFFDVPAITWLNRIFAVTAPPSNLPLAFLRDIFVCCLIGLVAAQSEKWFPWAGPALIAGLALIEFSTGGPLLLRPTILIFFGLGYGIAMFNPRSLVPSWPVVIAVMALDLLTGLAPGALPEEWVRVAGLFHRLAVALLMWRAALAIVQHNGQIRRGIQAVEPMIFLVFCSHMVSIMVMAAVFKTLGLAVTDTGYLLLFMLQVPVIFGVAMVIRSLGKACAPKLLGAMTGR